MRWRSQWCDGLQVALDLIAPPSVRACQATTHHTPHTMCAQEFTTHRRTMDGPRAATSVSCAFACAAPPHKGNAAAPPALAWGAEPAASLSHHVGRRTDNRRVCGDALQPWRLAVALARGRLEELPLRVHQTSALDQQLGQRLGHYLNVSTHILILQQPGRLDHLGVVPAPPRKVLAADEVEPVAAPHRRTGRNAVPQDVIKCQNFILLRAGRKRNGTSGRAAANSVRDHDRHFALHTVGFTCFCAGVDIMSRVLFR